MRAGSGGRYPCLDGFRALAALAVVATHLGFATGVSLDGGSMTYLGRGDIGVPVFFVLSGFLIYRPFALATALGAPTPPTVRYLLRRAVRILPAYWVAVCLGLALLAVNAGRRTVGEAVRQLLLVQFYGAGHSLRGLSQMWSLAAELAFYAVLPAWPRVVRRVVRAVAPAPAGVSAPDGRVLLRLECRLAAGLAAFGFVWILTVRRTTALGGSAGLWLPAHLDWFALGLVAAAVSVHLQTATAPARWALGTAALADAWTTCWLGAAAVFLLACTPVAGSYGLAPLSGWEAVTKELLYADFAALLVLPGLFGDQSAGLGRRLLRAGPLASLGRASYGLFLLHQIVIELVLSVGGIALFSHRIALVSVLVVPVSILAGYASRELVELPCTRLFARWTVGRGAAPGHLVQDPGGEAAAHR